ncbi:septal ring lytic transglycosylase RlpA family protein [Desulfoprunum benzoelyticum]|uniref:Probable endolytic peptidoglycan transglycosylase RlpA n=1 Tax=Desulfoprunum benzoelyticum TaxID=1506996 RepID=A0A840UU76_9BACT|nr:SPOR domain-containing protein [Desulfoprunum benzoelyticum]MBB5349342.1 rare lipoprotein A [Desulfoprunum benzoelyticum]MBM9531082.1 septal ring lytic transglycosylase RlpA family protein [Desulfoprunum benzoelyticum]
MISCTTTTTSSRSIPGVHDDTILNGAATLHRLRFLAFFLFFLVAIPTGSAFASYDRNPDAKPSSTLDQKDMSVHSPSDGYSETGLASWYGKSFQGKRTSSGERFDMHSMTAAHKQLPMNTLLKVKNLENGRETIVRVNDRGPYSGKRIIDLSHSAAKTLKLARKGIAKVEITVLNGASQGRIDEMQIEQNSTNTANSFYVQVGAFSRESNAKRMQERFAKAGQTVIIRQVSGKKSTIYRVLIAAGNDRDKALSTERKMRNNGYKEALVVVR